MQAVNTSRAYRGDWAHFMTWCSAKRRDALPAAPGTVATYLGDLAGQYKIPTILRWLAAISKMHTTCEFRSTTKHAEVRETLRRIRAERETAPRGKTALLTAEVCRVVRALPKTVLGVRDAALVLVGFAGGLRRSELAALRAEDVEITQEGLKIVVRSYNSDPGDIGREAEIPYGMHSDICPVLAYKLWIEVSGITAGPAFRRVDKSGRVGVGAITPQTVCLVVKHRCRQAGLDPKEFGANSLRSGLATQAALNGVSTSSIMKQTGHRSIASCRRCVQDAQLLRENAAAKLGL